MIKRAANRDSVNVALASISLLENHSQCELKIVIGFDYVNYVFTGYNLILVIKLQFKGVVKSLFKLPFLERL